MSRVVVVGASSGLGRCIGVGLGRRGDRVALLARRVDLLASAADRAGPDSFAVACDVTDEHSCREAVAAAAERLGGLDAVVYCVGLGVLAPVEELRSDEWELAFATNVVGASTVTAAALPHLRRSRGTVAYLSSVSASLTPPWPGLAAYTVTKAALDKLVEAWRAEHPEVGFTRVVVGDCAGGEGDAASQLAAGWDPDTFAGYLSVWAGRGLLDGHLLDVEELVEVLRVLVCSGGTATVPTVAVTPRATAAGPHGR
ncbi:MAG: SDR family oxidoreductase [Microthrixaceae bacterium]